MSEFARAPAFVDIHVHFRDPGFTEKEDIESGVRAAAAGGYRAVCLMPNTSPVIDDPAVLLAVDRAGRESGEGHGVRVLVACAMSRGLEGKELVDFDAMDGAETICKKLTGHGVCGITDDGKTLRDPDMMEKVCAAAARLGLTVLDHAEPEAEIVKRDIGLAEKTGAFIHIQHVSLADSVELIRRAKADGLPVTCETAPHYFALTEADTWQGAGGNGDSSAPMNTNAKMNPPLRKESDRLAVVEGLIDGTIDCVATDHAPHERAAKNVPYAEAANGVIGLETAFPVAYTVLVKSGIITFERLIELMSIRPAEIIGLPRDPAAMVDLDLDTRWTIDASAFLSKSANTPFDGMEVYGRVVRRLK